MNENLVWSEDFRALVSHLFSFLCLILVAHVWKSVTFSQLGNRFSYRGWGTGRGCLACVQEVRDAVNVFRYGHERGDSVAASSDSAGADANTAGSTNVDCEKGGPQQRRKFTIAVADTFGEGGPVRHMRAWILDEIT